MSRELAFGNTLLRYSIERSRRRRTVSVVVDPVEGILVKAPEELPVEDIEAVVARKGAWIVQRMAGYREAESARPPREFVGGETHVLQGRQYRLRLVEAASRRRATARVEGRFIVVDVPSSGDAAGRPGIVRDALVDLYRGIAAERLPERVGVFADKLGLPSPPVLIRDQQKRWGSCTRSGELRFNWRIIMGPMSLVDYVAAHEVCHLRIADHSPGFWRTLGNLMPDYEERRERLRIEGPRFQL
ncbi:MAG: M48 family metallopeptidase [Alphaproteobacteria bacterium]|nr:M48 family metallopeptidase [Alphaproteobacteria bacterium]